ncbi:MAG: hypothetical protein ACREBG_08780 [Pyrinomonadaceae bacterium]
MRTDSGDRSATAVDAPSSGSGGPSETTSVSDLTPWSSTLVQGWLSVAIWMAFGLVLEGLLGYKIPAYLQDEERRALFRLAHTHGTFLGLALIAAALCGLRFNFSPPRVARIAFRLGTSLMPVGFLLAGIWHYESDPGLAIWLVPPAALLIVFAAVAFALASRAGWHGEE